MALLAGVAGPRLHVVLAEALTAGLVTDALRGAPGVALTLLTLWVPVVTLSTGAAVLRPSERLLTLAQPVTGSTVAGVTGVRTVAS